MPEDQLLYSAVLNQELSTLFLQKVNHVGASKYDKQDRPLIFAFEAEEIIQRVLGDKPNYILAKSKAHIGKVYIAKGE